MALWAVGSPRLLGRDSIAAQCVLARRHWLNMGAVDTASVAAQMVGLEASRKGTD